MNSPIERFRLMTRMRAFDEACLEGVSTGEIHGELHTGIGQEGIAAGMAESLRPEDAVVSTHRNHFHAIAKDVPIRPLLAEIFERETGLCRGRGGHMHPFDVERNFSATGIVGASLPVALGYAFGFAIEGGGRIAVGVTGDGGANHGTFHETLNMAASWELPLIVLVENNHLAISVASAEVTATETISERSAAYGIPGVRVDGTDVDRVAESFAEAACWSRAENGPYLLEAVALRFQGHYEGDLQQYRAKAEREALPDHDPLAIARQRLLEGELSTDAELDRIVADATEEMRAHLEAVRSDNPPDPIGAIDHVFAER